MMFPSARFTLTLEVELGSLADSGAPVVEAVEVS